MRPTRLSRRGFVASWFLVPVAIYGDESNAVELYIETDGEFLAFKPTELTCPAAAHVTLTFHHAGRRIQQQHDWVLLEPGTADAFMQAVLKAGEKNDWMPPHDPRVIAATPQIGPGESTTIEFTAPPSGDYPFVCTFAGHGEVMRGTLHVAAQDP
jgi:azurin